MLAVDTSAAYTSGVPDAPAIIFGRNLERLRESRGLTQEALAERLHKRQSTLSNMENGKSGLPKSQTLRQIAAALDYPMEKFLEGVPDKPDTKQTQGRRLKKGRLAG
jgi:transcriptional regulator with XRE-family HTH domain